MLPRGLFSRLCLHLYLLRLYVYLECLEGGKVNFSFTPWEQHWFETIPKGVHFLCLLLCSLGYGRSKIVCFLQKARSKEGRLSAPQYPWCIPPTLDEEYFRTCIHTHNSAFYKLINSTCLNLYHPEK